ncbi:MAG: hypothetical protein M3P08_07690 [Thermoproteota archaeon]|nr:hypothetical protein [Thermoproteota archaeon]
MIALYPRFGKSDETISKEDVGKDTVIDLSKLTRRQRRSKLNKIIDGGDNKN